MENSARSNPSTTPELNQAFAVAERLTSALSKVIRGRDDTIKLTLTALFADGHLLLEDYPGSGKTTLTKALGKLIGADDPLRERFAQFRRIQFTPDMLPGDVLGVNIFEPKSGQFQFLAGPIFAHVVLADEINRAGPKVQSAFLECMAEKQVTIDNVTHALDELFFVVGTQNPLDIAGTYPLPIVQLDRFLLKVPMSYVDAATEQQILSEHGTIAATAAALTPVCTRSEVLAARAATQQIAVSPAIREAIVGICQATRNNPLLQFGASTRAALMIQSAMRGWALLNGRGYTTEDDLKAVLPYALLHRLRFFGGVQSARDALMQLATPAFEALARR